MAAIDHVKAHFARLEIHTIEVPEWAGEDGRPLVIYCRPITLAEKQKIFAAGEREGRMAMLATALILKAEDGQGAKLFTLEHKHALMHHADPDVVADVVSQMMTSPSVEDAEKNSPRTPNSL